MTNFKKIVEVVNKYGRIRAIKITEIVGITRQRVYDHLNRAVDEGLIHHDKMNREFISLPKRLSEMNEKRKKEFIESIIPITFKPTDLERIMIDEEYGNMYDFIRTKYQKGNQVNRDYQLIEAEARLWAYATNIEIRNKNLVLSDVNDEFIRNIKKIISYILIKSAPENLGDAEIDLNIHFDLMSPLLHYKEEASIKREHKNIEGFWRYQFELIQQAAINLVNQDNSEPSKIQKMIREIKKVVFPFR
jgi:hypothetical protein